MNILAFKTAMQNFVFTVFLQVSFFFSWLTKRFTNEQHLHSARYAWLHELRGLISRTIDGPFLLIGVTKNGHFLRVKPRKEHKELENVLVIGRIRCGKALLAKPQIL